MDFPVILKPNNVKFGFDCPKNIKINPLFGVPFWPPDEVDLKNNDIPTSIQIGHPR